MTGNLNMQESSINFTKTTGTAGNINLGGGKVNTSGGSVNTGGGSINTNGGNVNMSNGSLWGVGQIGATDRFTMNFNAGPGTDPMLYFTPSPGQPIPKIRNISDPVNEYDAVNKRYLETVTDIPFSVSNSFTLNNGFVRVRGSMMYGYLYLTCSQAVGGFSSLIEITDANRPGSLFSAGYIPITAVVRKTGSGTMAKDPFYATIRFDLDRIAIGRGQGNFAVGDNIEIQFALPVINNYVNA